MNAEVYLFGKSTQDQYFQYPQDYTQFIFQNFQKHAKEKTQLFIHRNGKDLVYYAYIRKIGNSESQYIGFCFVLNGILITDEKALFHIFENMVGNLVKNNNLVELDIQGILVSKAFTTKDLQNEFNSFRLNIQLELDQLNYDYGYLPPLNNHISSSEVQYYTAGKGTVDIREVFSECDNILINKESDFDTKFLFKFKQLIATWQEREKDANKKYNYLDDEYSQLTNKYAKLKREKKQTTFVAILVFCLFSGILIGLTVLNQKEQLVSQKNQRIEDQENVISAKNESIKDKDISIASLKIRNESLRTDVQYLTSKVKEKEITIDSLHVEINDLKQQLVNGYSRGYNLKSYSGSSTNTFKNEKMREKYVNVYNGTGLQEQPVDFSRVIKSLYDNEKLFLVRDFSDKYYYVKLRTDYGYIYGYISKGLIKGNVKHE